MMLNIFARFRKEDVVLTESFISIINDERIHCNLLPVSSNEALDSIALYRSEDMIRSEYFGHYDSGGNLAFQKLLDEQLILYSQAGEIIARSDQNGKSFVNSIMDGFMGSLSHRKIILTSGYDKIGIGIVEGKNNMRYITIIFIDTYTNYCNLGEDKDYSV